jgi:hypothetical protein
VPWRMVQSGLFPVLVESLSLAPPPEPRPLGQLAEPDLRDPFGRRGGLQGCICVFGPRPVSEVLESDKSDAVDDLSTGGSTPYVAKAS